jgi:MFS transporter, SP family, sugar:H+ symporter
MGLALVWPVVMGVGILFLPESPRWDYRYGNEDRAARTMAAMLHVPIDHPRIVQELSDIKSVEEAEKVAGAAKWHEFFTAPTMRKRVLVGMTLQMGQQMTGINYFFYFGVTLFSSAGIGNSYVTGVILGLVNVGATIVGLWVGERLGRRKALLAGALEMAIALFVSASNGYMFERIVC